MAGIGQELLAWMRAVFVLTFFSAKSPEKSLYTKNHSKRVLWPSEVLFQIWKPSMQICHCQTQICAGGIKKEKKNQKKISDESIRHRVIWTGCLIIWQIQPHHYIRPLVILKMAKVKITQIFKTLDLVTAQSWAISCDSKGVFTFDLECTRS